MRIKHLLLLLFYCFSKVIAQQNPLPTHAIGNISLKENVYYLCKGTTYNLIFLTHGKFESNNIFTVEYIINDKTESRIVGSGSKSPIEIKIPDDFNAGGYSGYFQITSSNPMTSNVYYFELRSKPDLMIDTLNISTVQTILPFQSVGIPVKSQGNPAGTTIELNDGNTVAYNGGQFLYINPLESGVYKIKKASNQCGIQENISGSVTVEIDKKNITAWLPKTTYCRGETIYFDYKSQQIIDDNDGLYAVISKEDSTQKVPVKVNTILNTIELKPDKPLTVGYHTVRLLNKNARQLQIYTVSISPYYEPKLPPSGDFEIGEGFTFPLELTGFTQLAVLNSNTGLVEHLAKRDAETIPIFLALKPTTDTKYILKDAKYTCGNINHEGVLNIKIKKGFVLEDLSTYAACVGESVTVKFSTTLKLEEFKDKLRVIVGSGNQSKNTFDFSKTLVPTSITDNTATFQCPEELLGVINFVQLTAEINGKELKSVFSRAIMISQKPNISFSGSFQEFPYGGGRVIARFKRNSPFLKGFTKIELSNGYVYDMPQGYEGEYSTEFLVSSSEVFSVKSVSSECGLGVSNGMFSIVIDRKPNDPAIFFKRIGTGEKAYCAGQEIDLNFEVWGKMPDTTFYAEFSSEQNGVRAREFTIKLDKNSTKIKLPSEVKVHGGLYILRIRNGNINSEPYFLGIYNGTQANISVYGNEISNQSGQTAYVIKDQPFYLQLWMLGMGPYEYELSDGRKGRAYDYYDSILMSIPKDATYSFKSLVGRCGALKESPKLEVKTIAPQVAIVSNGSFSQSVCAGSKFKANYLVFGKFPAQFTIKARAYLDKNFVDLEVLDNENPVSIKLPNNMQTGTYKLKLFVADKDGKFDDSTDPLMFGSIGLVVTTTPKITSLTAADGTNAITLEPSYNYFSVNYISNLSNTLALPALDGQILNWSYYLSKSGTMTYYNASKGGDFQLFPLPNSCGYGEASPKITVSYKAGIRNLVYNNSICKADNFIVGYQTVGDFGANNKFSVSLKNEKREIIKPQEVSNVEGKITISLIGIPVGQYDLIIESTNPITKTEGILYIQDKPTAKLISPITIYKGESTNLSAVLGGGGLFQMTFLEGDALKNFIWSQARNDQAQLYVMPDETTTFKIGKVMNACGETEVNSSVIVMVREAPKNYIKINSGNSDYYCTNGKIATYFQPSWTSADSTKFSVQISDENGENYKTIPSTSLEYSKNALEFSLPADLKIGGNYHYRIVSTSPTAESSPSNTIFKIMEGASAKLSGSKDIFRGDSAAITIDFKGKAPWSFSILPFEGNSFSGSTEKTPFVFYVKPTESNSYRLQSVFNNECGTGVFEGIATIRIVEITSTEDEFKNLISVFPNPTSDKVKVDLSKINTHNLHYQLINLSGQILESGAIKEEIDMSKFPRGMYLLNLKNQMKETTFRIIKE